MGVIDQGTVHIGDHLDLIQPGSAAAAAPLRVKCLGVDPAPRVTGRDPALGYPIAILIGPDIEPEAIQAGAKLQVAGPLTTVKSSLSRSPRGQPAPQIRPCDRPGRLPQQLRQPRTLDPCVPDDGDHNGATDCG